MENDLLYKVMAAIAGETAHEAHFNRIDPSDVEDADVCILLALFYRRHGDFDRAQLFEEQARLLTEADFARSRLSREDRPTLKSGVPMSDNLLEDVRAALAGGPGTPAAKFSHITPGELEDTNTCNALGDLYGRTGNSQRAFAFYHRAAGLYRLEGQNTKAIAILRKATRLGSPPVEALWELGELYAAEGFKAEASGQFLRFADANRRAGNALAVLKAYERIVALDPENAHISVILADMYAKSGLLEKATREYERALDLLRDRQEQEEVERINAKLRTLKVPPAERPEESRPVSRRESSDLIVLPEGGMELDIVEEEPAEAAREPEYESVFEEEPTDELLEEPTTEEGTGVILYASFDKIISEFKQAMSTLTEGDDPQGHYDLGIAYKEMGMLNEAIIELQAASKHERFQTKALPILAECFNEKKMPELAVKQLERAIALTDSEQELLAMHYRAAMLCLELGRRDEGAMHLQECFGIDPGYLDVARRLKRLT
ncbi:MAG TPA: tetratricopeptide repeat protein [Candidatus Coatesbacteria bacterium]|nr:tetratricopeptide repeat protein [Candidatus Coatesbacteria bacterium]